MKGDIELQANLTKLLCVPLRSIEIIKNKQTFFKKFVFTFFKLVSPKRELFTEVGKT